MSEQEKPPTFVEQIDRAKNPQELAGITKTILYSTEEFLAAKKEKEKRDEDRKERALGEGRELPRVDPWIAFKKKDFAFLVRWDKKDKNVFRIDKKFSDEIVESAQFVYDGTEKDFDGLTYIKGKEVAEMVYSEEGSYKSDYETPIGGNEAVPMVKDIIKSLL